MIYKWLLPSTALISFILFLLFIWINKGYIKVFLLEIDKKTWFFLTFLLVFAFGLRLILLPLQHIMYIDEPWYMEAAKNMLQNFQQGNYPKSIGWPFILTISFFFFGVSNWTAIYTAIVLGSLTVLNIFFLTYIITRNKIVSLFSAGVFALLPLHIRWSASAETNVPSLFFVILTIFFFFLYYQKQKYSLFGLAIFSATFTSLFRPENYLLLPLFFIGVLIFKIKVSLKQIIIISFLILILIIPAVIQSINFQTSVDWLEKESQGYIQGSNWSLSNLIYNSLNSGPVIFNPKYLPFFISFLSIIGFFQMLFKRPKEACFLVAWFIFFWVIYFSSWFQVLGGKNRFYLSFYPIILIFAGFSWKLFTDLIYKLAPIARRKELINFFLIFLIIFLLFPYAFEAKNIYISSKARLATKLPKLAEDYFSSDVIIVANWPTILRSTTDLNVVDINTFLFNHSFQKKLLESKELIFFLEGYFCIDSSCSWSKEACDLMKKGFKLIPYKEFKEKDIKFTFYKIMGRL